MLLHKWKILRTKNICIFLQCILLTLFVSTALAKPSCRELVNPLKKNTDSIASNGGLWSYFEKDLFLRKHSTQAMQLDSRINKIFFTLNYLCETKDGIPLNDLATYISRSISDKGEAAFKAELITLGKTSQQIENWFEFFKYAQSHRSRTLDSSAIKTTINRSIPLIKTYTSLTKSIGRPNSSKVLLKMTRTLITQIDSFFSSDPYITQALDEISHVPYWDINESSGGS